MERAKDSPRDTPETTSEIQQSSEEDDRATQENEQEESRDDQSSSLPNQVPHGMSAEAREQILGEYTPPRDSQSSHFGVIETVYYRSPGMNPIDISIRFHRMIDTDEQVYDRTIKSLEEEKGWVPLDTGWLESAVGHIVIHNTSSDKESVILLGTTFDPYRVKPTDEDIVEICRIPSRESTRMTPVNVERLFLKSVKGTAKVRLFVIPE